jgi:Zn finger protein HypA/HybF involved in hydrogenase expression
MALLKTKPVKVICRNCESESYADDFKLDNIKGIMVCPGCEKKPSVEKIKETVEENGVDKKPVGWDEVDDYLESAFKNRKVEKKPMEFEKVEGSKYHVNYVCKNCEYKFKYNTLKHWPRVCPACSKIIEAIESSF